jgi:hypothetical protein
LGDPADLAIAALAPDSVGRRLLAPIASQPSNT